MGNTMCNNLFLEEMCMTLKEKNGSEDSSWRFKRNNTVKNYPHFSFFSEPHHLILPRSDYYTWCYQEI